MLKIYNLRSQDSLGHLENLRSSREDLRFKRVCKTGD